MHKDIKAAIVCTILSIIITYLFYLYMQIPFTWKPFNVITWKGGEIWNQLLYSL